jgi:hypothetical protein
MDYIKQISFKISQCDVSDILTETNRFMFHITLIHIITHIIDGKDDLFGEQIFKTLIVTALAILVYNVIFKKIVEPKLKELHSTCNASKKIINKH